MDIWEDRAREVGGVNAEAFEIHKIGAVKVKAFRAVVADRGTCRSIKGRIMEAIIALRRVQAFLSVSSVGKASFCLSSSDVAH